MKFEPLRHNILAIEVLDFCFDHNSLGGATPLMSRDELRECDSKFENLWKNGFQPPKEINGNTALTVQVQRLTCKCYCYYYVACKCH